MNILKQFWKTGKNGKLIIIAASASILICLCCVSVFVLAALSPTSPETTTFETPVPTPSSTEAPTNTPALNSRCVPASQAQIYWIREGIHDIDPNNDIKSAWAVRSNDYKRIWMVAAEITGPGINPKEAIGLWALTGELEEPTSCGSVDGFANNFSSWGDLRSSDAQVTMYSDGAQEAIDCATNDK